VKYISDHALTGRCAAPLRRLADASGVTAELLFARPSLDHVRRSGECRRTPGRTSRPGISQVDTEILGRLDRVWARRVRRHRQRLVKPAVVRIRVA